MIRHQLKQWLCVSFFKPASARRSPARPLFSIEALEPKVLLSADILGGALAADALSDNHESPFSENKSDTELNAWALQSSQHIPDQEAISASADELMTIMPNAANQDDNQALGQLLADTALASSESEGQALELIIVDPATPDYVQLIEGLAPAGESNYLVYLLDAERDGIAQVSELLAAHQELDAVHLISHGSEQGFQLGATWLNNDSLERHSESIQAWNSAFDAEADILIYGCNLAASNAGQELIDSLASLTGADVAGSNDLTGGRELGGDWELEYHSGEVEHSLAMSTAAQTQWNHVLAANTLWLSTGDSAADGGGLVGDKTDILSIDDPNLALELGDGSSGTTDGTFSNEYDLPENVRALHHVSQAVTVDTFVGNVAGSYNLSAGQLVLSMQADDSLDFLLPTTGGGNITVNNTDVLVYTPGTGEYEFLLQDAVFESDALTQATIHAVTIVETTTTIGVDTTLTAGTYIIARSDPGKASDILTFDTSNGLRELLLGSDIMQDDTQQIQGLELVEADTDVGGVTLNSGTLLASTTSDQIVGTTGETTVLAQRGDVMALTINATELDSGIADSNVDAQILFDASDIPLSISNSQSINALAIANDGSASAPTASNLTQSLTFDERSASVPIDDIVVTDSTLNEVITATLTLADNTAGSLTAGTFGSATSTYSPGTGVWTVTGSVADVNAALADVAFVPANNAGVSTTISTHIEDQLGTGPADGSITLTSAPGEVKGLLFTTAGDVSSATTPGLSDWADGDVLEFSDSDLALEPNTTNGHLSSIISLDDFNPTGDGNVTITAMHRVSTDLTLGTGVTFDLLAGDLLLSVDQAEVLRSSDLSTLIVGSEDVFVFRPDTANDYSSGMFYQVLTDLTAGGGLVTGVSLIEQDTVVGDGLLPTGDLIVSLQDVGKDTNTIYYVDVDQAGAATSGTIAPLINGLEIGINDAISGLELVENDIRLGGVDIASGSILFSINTSGVVGDNALAVNAEDISVLDVSFISRDHPDPTPDQLAVANASLLFDGSDVGFSGANYAISSLSMAEGNTPVATNMNQTHNYNEGDASVVLDPIVVTDVDFDEVITATLTLAGDPPMVITGTVDEVNAALAGIVFNPLPDNDINTVITVHIEDSTGFGPADGVINLNVTPQEDAPTATNLSQTLNYTEGDASVALDDIVVTDVDTGATVSATLTLADPAAGALTTGTFGASTSTYVAGTGVWTVSGTIADVNTALAAVAFVPATNNDANTTITTHVEDNTGRSPTDGTITLNVTPLNDAPSASNLSQNLAYNEGDASVALTDIVVSDVDTGETITATLTLANVNTGALTTGTFGTATSSYTAGTGVWTVTGTVADVNAALAAVAFVPTTDNDLDTSISTHIEDAAGVGPVDGSIVLDVTPQNDAPSATNLSQNLAYNEGEASVALNDIVVSDVDTNEIVTATLTLANTTTGSLSTGTFGAATSSYTVGTGVWTVSGSVVDVNAALAAVAFVPATNNGLDTTITTHIEDAAGAGPVDGSITLDVTPAPIRGLLLSSDGDVAGSTTPGLSNWVDGEVLELSNPNFNLEPGVTDGSLSSVINLNDFNPVGVGGDNDVAITAMHIVTRDLTLGTGVSFDLLKGDLLLATNQTETLSSTNTLTVNKEDVFVFRPDNENDYSSGTFHQLLTDLATSGEQLNAISLIETDVVVGNDSFSAGSIIFAQQDEGAGRQDNNIYHAEINQAGAASDYDVERFIVGSDIKISDTITGLELLENNVHLGNTDMDAGNILISVGSAGTIGDNDFGVTANDVSILDVTRTSRFDLLGLPIVTAAADASLIFEGADIDFTGAGYEVSAIALGANEVPEVSNMNQSHAYNEGDASVALDDMVVTDIDVTETVTATLTLSDPAAGALTTGSFGTATSSYTAGTGIWTVSGSLDDVNAALAAVAFQPATDYDLDSTITTHIVDSQGLSPLDGIINLNVTALNDAPTATNLTQSLAYTEGDASVALNDIVVSDVDTNETVTATLTLADTTTGALTTGTFGAATSSYTVGTGVWTVSGTVADVNAALAAVAFVPTTDNDVDTTITTHIEDAAGTGPADGQIDLTVTPQNDAPNATNLTQNLAYSEGDASVALNDIVVSDVDTGETVTATLTLADTTTGALTTGTFGAATSSYTVGMGVWTVSGTVADVNAALAAVAFVPNTDNDVDTTITTHIEDAAGAGPADGQIDLTVTPQNDAPNATNLTQNLAYTEGDASVALNDIVVTDVDTNETITATLTLANSNAGALTTGTFGVATSSYTVGTGVWTVSGTVADVNAALAAVAFVPTTDNDVDTTIATHIEDAVGAGPADGQIDLTVTPQNDAPNATNLTQNLAYTEDDASVALNDIVVTDVDTNETVTATLTLADTTTGALTTGTFGAATSSYTAGTGVWTVSGTVADVNAALAAVAFVPTTDNDLDTSISTHIEDAAGAGPADGQIDLTVTPQNDAPSATNLTQNLAYTEGDASVALNDIVVTDVDTNETVTATLTLANSNAGALTTGTFGAATSSYTVGTGVWTVSGTVADVNAALAAVAFEPTTDNDVDTTITTHIEDAVGAGPADGQIDLTVTPQNDAPNATNLSQNLAYTEGDASVALNDIVVSDVDNNETITATLTLANRSTGSLTTGTFGAATSSYNVGTGVWTVSGSVSDVNAALAAVAFMPASDNDVDTTITTHIEDAAGAGPADGQIDLAVTPQNDDPVLANAIADQAATESTAFNFTFAANTFNDVDTGNVLSYSATQLGGGALPAWLNFDAATRSFSGTPANADVGSITIEVTADDGQGGTVATTTFDLTVANINNAPVLVSAIPDQSVTEDIASSFTIAANTFSDIDNGDVLSYSAQLTGGAALPDWLSFDAATRTFSGTPTNADVGMLAIDVRADDGNGGVATDTFNVAVVNSNDNPQGRVVIAGDAIEGFTLAADTSGLSDDDGLGSYRYSWLRNGIEITGATEARYLLSANDVGQRISVEVSYTDGHGTLETVRSQAIIASEQNIPEPPQPEAPAPEEPEAPEAPAPVIEPEPELEPEPETEASDAEEEEPEEVAEVVAEEGGPAEPLAIEEAIVDSDSFAAQASFRPDVTREYDPGSHANQEQRSLSFLRAEQQSPVLAAQENLRTQNDFLLGYQDPLQLIRSDNLVESLDQLRQDIDERTSVTQTVVGSSLAVSAGMSAGYVAWLARSGVLLSSVLGSMPVWRMVDPLPVLTRVDGSAAGDDESLESLVSADDGDAATSTPEQDDDSPTKQP